MSDSVLSAQVLAEFDKFLKNIKCLKKSLDGAGVLANNEPTAIGLALMSLIRTRVNNEYKVLEARAREEGVLPEECGVAGTTSVVYEGKLVSVSVRVNNPSSRFDKDKLRGELQALKLSPMQIKQVFSTCTLENKPAQVVQAGFKE